MQKNTIIQIITDWQNHILKVRGIERTYETVLLSAMNSRPVKIVTGFRRSGKSFLVQRTARILVEKNYFNISSILYLNFEDYRLMDVISPERLNEIYSVFRIDVADNGKKLLIFDEIQNVENWDRFIHTIYERDNDIEIILTGSNSELLSSEIGSNLAGRFIEISIFPFNFSEYLLYHNVSVTDRNDFFRNREEIEKHFSVFMKYGGLPEIFTINDEHASFSYLEGILSKVILDDIIDRFNVKQPVIVEKILLYLFSAVGNRVSFNRIANYLQNLGISIKQETIIQYVQYILKTFALYEVQKFDWKLGKIFSTTRKYFAVDIGLTNLLPSSTSLYGSQLENLVFLALKGKGQPLYFGSLQNGKEIDFIMKHDEGYDKYQVTRTLHNDNYEREISVFSLHDFQQVPGENILLTLDSDETELYFKDAVVKKRNLILWLLDIQ